MTVLYTSTDGDMVDEIAWKYYGTTANGQAEAVLFANPGLADYGPILPAGVTITLPDVTTAAQTSQGVKLWD